MQGSNPCYPRGRLRPIPATRSATRRACHAQTDADFQQRLTRWVWFLHKPQIERSDLSLRRSKCRTKYRVEHKLKTGTATRVRRYRLPVCFRAIPEGKRRLIVLAARPAMQCFIRLDAAVAQLLFHVDHTLALLEEQRRKGMPEVVDADVAETGFRKHPLEHVPLEHVPDTLSGCMGCFLPAVAAPPA